MQDLKIIFFGTPDFAVASLKALLDAGQQVVAVVTAPDKPAGRGLKMHPSAVKEFAIQHDIPVLQPEKLKSEEFIRALDAFNPDIQVVVAFRMLPELVWNRPRLGTINVHASLLPDYRGAAPINWAIIDGNQKTGVTTFKLQHAIDTGDILLQEEVGIANDETAGSLHDKLMLAGARLLVQTIHGLQNETLHGVPQKSLPENRHAPKLFPENCAIHWDWPGKKIDCHVRGLAPYPGAFTTFEGKRLKVFSVLFESGQTSFETGSYQFTKDELTYTCSDGVIKILELQLEGKSRMSVNDFLRGWRRV